MRYLRAVPIAHVKGSGTVRPFVATIALRFYCRAAGVCHSSHLRSDLNMSRELPHSFELEDFYPCPRTLLNDEGMTSRQCNTRVACSSHGAARPTRRAPEPRPHRARHLVPDAFGAAETARPWASLAGYHLRPVPSLLRCL